MMQIKNIPVGPGFPGNGSLQATGSPPPIPDPKAHFIMPVLEALAYRLGLPALPETIRRANPDIFEGITFGLSSFLILYAHYYDAGKIPPVASIGAEWRELTPFTAYISNRTLCRYITEIFNRQIVGRNSKKVSRRSKVGYSKFARTTW